jgi:hypothetical protein
MVTLEVYNPSGVVDTTMSYAPRLSELSGKKICEVSNGVWEYQRTFPLIRELLKKQFPNVTFVPYSEFPMDSRYNIEDKISELVKEKGCEAVIGGNAG